MGCIIQAALKEYRIRQAATTGEDVEKILSGDPPLPREAWSRIRGWYRSVVDHAPLPARITPERVTA